MPDKQLNALMELERRMMAGDPKITPEISAQIKAKMGAYRAQGLAKPIGGGKAPAAVTPEKVAALDALSRQLGDVRKQYDAHFKGGGWLDSALEYLPTEESAGFNSAAAGLSDQALAAFRTPGVGSQSDRELKSFVAANQPSNTDFDSAVEQKLKNIENRLVSRRRALGLPDYASPLNPDDGQAKKSGAKNVIKTDDGYTIEEH